MKRKLSKKVLCLCIVAVLAVCLAIPTFAAATFTRADVHGSYYSVICSLPNSNHTASGATVTVSQIYKADGGDSDYQSVMCKAVENSGIRVMKGTATSLPYADDAKYNELYLQAKGYNPLLDCRISGSFDKL